jgi:hypothetical protein
MSRVRLKLGLSGLTIANFLIRCNTIKEAIVANVMVFVTPNPTMIVLETAITNLTASQGRMDEGGPANTLLRDQDYLALLNHMRTLGIYVENIAQGDLDIILLSKFEVVGQPSSVGLLPGPSIVRVKGDSFNAGELYVSWQGVRNSTGYVVGISLMVDGAPSTWIDVKPKGTNHLFTGLQSGAQYAIRIATMSREGVGPWCDPRFHRPQ